MKKLKKLSKNKSPNLVLIYGPIVAGKLTVGKELEKITKYRLVHNHIIIDFTKEIFPEHHSFSRQQIQERLYIDVVKYLMQAKQDTILTLAYAHSYISKTGISDPVFIRKIRNAVLRTGGNFYPVHLVPIEKEILRRVVLSSRKKFKKLTDKKTTKKLMQRENMYRSAHFHNNLVIDNTKLSAKKVAKIIEGYFNL